MKGVAVLMVATFVLAGCVQENPAHDESEEDLIAGNASWVAPVMAIDSVDVTPESIGSSGEVTYSWVVSGTVDKESWVWTSIDPLYDDTNEGSLVTGGAFNGTFVLSSPDFILHPGSHRILVAVTLMDDAGQPIRSYEGEGPAPWMDQTPKISFPAPATVTIDYGSASSKEPVNDTVWVDLVDYDAQSHYDDEGVEHPGYTNAHDVMAAWEEQHDHAVEYSYNPSFNSFSVESIDGHGNGLAGSPPWWCYQVNGEYAGQGISIQRFQSGDVIAWDLGTCGGVMGGT